MIDLLVITDQRESIKKKSISVILVAAGQLYFMGEREIQKKENISLFSLSPFLSIGCLLLDFSSAIVAPTEFRGRENAGELCFLDLNSVDYLSSVAGCEWSGAFSMTALSLLVLVKELGLCPNKYATYLISKS